MNTREMTKKFIYKNAKRHGQQFNEDVKTEMERRKAVVSSTSQERAATSIFEEARDALDSIKAGNPQLIDIIDSCWVQLGKIIKHQYKKQGG